MFLLHVIDSELVERIKVKLDDAKCINPKNNLILAIIFYLIFL